MRHVIVSLLPLQVDWIIERIYRNHENKFKGEEGKRFTPLNKIIIIINE